MLKKTTLHAHHVIACVWDFDKTLIPGYMQTPLFKAYGIDEKVFWEEVNALPSWYQKDQVTISNEIAYLNHLLTYIKHGKLKGLNNAVLRKLGSELTFYNGLPNFFQKLRESVGKVPEYQSCNIALEHYIISTGLAEMIRGSAIAPFVSDIFGCELLENPLPPGFMTQPELLLNRSKEISQIGRIVDNTIKTRFLFEINKGSNKHPEIEVNAVIAPEDRRIPLSNMIYIADGPSDIPVFSVIKNGGGKAYAVYEPGNRGELRQNDALRANKRVDHYGSADYSEGSSTAEWIEMQVLEIADRIVQEHKALLKERVGSPPKHLHKEVDSPTNIHELNQLELL
jgi:hypothetical protein